MEAFSEHTVTVAGEEFKIEFFNDYDASPFDAGCYDPEDIQAWRNDQWYYIGIKVTSAEFPNLSDSLWELEYDFPLNPPQEHNGHTFTRTNENYRLTVYPVPNIIGIVQRMIKAERLRLAIESFIYG